MANLTTNFIKVAQAGPAFDGRTIQEAWLRDMAETYDPAVYTAMLWPEHMRWFGQLGEVAELRAGPDEKGVYSLFARLKPNKRLLEWNAEGQGLFYSIEVEEDFPGCPGKTYLGGLGVTDSPASLGLVSARFSNRKDTKAPHCMSNVSFDPSALEPAPADELPGWFKKHVLPFFTQNNGGAASEAKDDSTMPEQTTEERLEALEKSYEAVCATLGDIEVRLTECEKDIDALEEGVEGGGSEDSSYKAIINELGAMRDAFTAALGTVKPGTRPPTNTAPAEGKGII